MCGLGHTKWMQTAKEYTENGANLRKLRKSGIGNDRNMLNVKNSQEWEFLLFIEYICSKMNQNPRSSPTRITWILSLCLEYLVTKNWQQMVSGDLQL